MTNIKHKTAKCNIILKLLFSIYSMKLIMFLDYMQTVQPKYKKYKNI